MDELPEVAIVGRSNVGKSSLFNAVCGRKGLARVSRSPGRTQFLNTFRLVLLGPGRERRHLRCVDLPGYGFAAAGRATRETFAPMIGGYLKGRASLRSLVLLVDIRRGLSDLDEQMLGFAAERGVPSLLVATKVDKMGAAERALARERLAVGTGVRPIDVLLTSSTKGLGVGELVADLAGLAAPPRPAADV